MTLATLLKLLAQILTSKKILSFYFSGLYLPTKTIYKNFTEAEAKVAN